jgi:chemotaxis signal transduction protein
MKFVTFHVANCVYGAAVEYVQEVLRQQELTPIPLASRATPGLLHLRGQILTAIDLRALFDPDACALASRSVCVVVRDGELGAALLADRVGEVLEVDPGQTAPVPTHWQGPVREYVTAVVDRGDRILRILDIAHIAGIEAEVEGEAELTTNTSSL